MIMIREMGTDMKLFSELSLIIIVGFCFAISGLADDAHPPNLKISFPDVGQLWGGWSDGELSPQLQASEIRDNAVINFVRPCT